MIFPDEYKNVGVTSIHPDDAGNKVYFLSDYIIAEQKLDNGTSKYLLYHVKKSGEELLQNVESIDIIASGKQIIKYEKELNIKNRALLIETASKLCQGDVNTVIFTGVDKHVTFVHAPDPSSIIEIEIVDVVPPEPSWLIHVIRRLETSGIFGDFGLRFSENVTDLRQFEGEDTVFPCTASGLKGKYLDSDIITKNGSLIVGCEISRTLVKLRFPELEYTLVNICPFKSDIFKPTKPFITRCCRSDRSGLVTINDIEGVVVHWGASEFDVAEAIRKLVLHIKEQG
ncbi:MAG TPA: hypothetical protein C5S50_09315 [Methanosarcinaceae archaeon]|nr:hypothetical protein [Methanosarcinaceae archaeon]